MWTKLSVLLSILVAVMAAVGGLNVPDSAAQQADPAWGLTSNSAGPIVIDAPLDSLTDFDVSDERPIDGSTVGHAVSRDGRLVALVGTDGEADARINLIIVVGEAFRTADGIGPGSAVAAAEAAYGTAIISYDPNASSREVLSVSSGPPGLLFVTSDDGPRAGVYPDGRFATIEYSPQATISSVWIDCRQRPCPEPAEPAAPSLGADVPETLAVTGTNPIVVFAGLSVLASGLLALGTRNLVSLVDHDARRRERFGQ